MPLRRGGAPCAPACSPRPRQARPAGGLAALIGIAAVHQRLTRRLDGERSPAWLLPTTLLIAAAGAVLFVAWTHQI
ncbi:hypothetical protein [Micromonospora sp. NPDC049102]|uniref:hypothetical protein n=1 Tax=Micromonospora sp. NPDC049102 TaxID=3364265 RepID=UPI003717B21E